MLTPCRRGCNTCLRTHSTAARKWRLQNGKNSRNLGRLLEARAEDRPLPRPYHANHNHLSNKTWLRSLTRGGLTTVQPLSREESPAVSVLRRAAARLYRGGTHPTPGMPSASYSQYKHRGNSSSNPGYRVVLLISLCTMQTCLVASDVWCINAGPIFAGAVTPATLSWERSSEAEGTCRIAKSNRPFFNRIGPFFSRISTIFRGNSPWSLHFQRKMSKPRNFCWGFQYLRTTKPPVCWSRQGTCINTSFLVQTSSFLMQNPSLVVQNSSF